MKDYTYLINLDQNGPVRMGEIYRVTRRERNHLIRYLLDQLEPVQLVGVP